MPFTLAHPAIALPLKKINGTFSATALVAGSMVPDFENFLKMQEGDNSWHHCYGILLFDIPVALLACYIFHNLLKYAFIRNLPSIYRNRFERVLYFNWNSFAIQNKWGVFLSLVAGIMTHLFWDAFTHKDGIFVVLIPFLSATIHVVKHSFPVHFILQIISSIAGLIVLQKMVINIPVQPVDAPLVKADLYYWPIFLIIIAAIILTRLLIWPELNIYLGILKACIGAGLYAWLLVSVIFKTVQ